MSMLLCLLATEPYVSHGFRSGSLKYTHRKALRNSVVARADKNTSECTVKDPSTEYLVLEYPVKVAWDVISEYIVPLCHSEHSKQNTKARPVLLSCSGGADSMSLLHALGTIKTHAAAFVRDSAWKRIFGTQNEVDHRSLYMTLKSILDTIHVVYFNHKSRSDTDVDIKVVKSGCEKYGFHFVLQQAEGEVADLANSRISGNFQSQARNWRRQSYKQLISTIGVANCDSSSGDEYDPEKTSKIFNRRVLTQELQSITERNVDKQFFHDKVRGIVLLAHHANDNVETFMFKLIRGVHLSNLMGMDRISYLDEDEDIVLARPFLRLTKDELHSFLEKVGGEYHEDSSNASNKYMRNRIRKRVIPELVNAMSPDENSDIVLKSLDKRFHALASQSAGLQKTVELETYMFNQYISKKYGVPNTTEKPKNHLQLTGADSHIPFSQLEKAYSDFYQSMYNLRYDANASDKTQRYIRTLGFLRGIGFNMKDIMLVNEWSIVMSDIVRKNIIHQFCTRVAGDDLMLDNNVLERLSTTWINEPIADVVKMHHLRKDIIIYHQGSLVKANRPKTPPSSSTVVYNDDHCSFQVSDNFTASVSQFKEDDGGNAFYLQLSVPSEGVDGRPIALDIRQMRDDDVVPTDALWNRKATSVLSKMKFPQILTDEVPVIALHDTNQVVCFYGLNTSPPYYVPSPQSANLSFGRQSGSTGEYISYRIHILGN